VSDIRINKNSRAWGRHNVQHGAIGSNISL
jgi:hypothetical protein